MSQKEIAFKIEELELQAEQIFSLQKVLFAAVYHQEAVPVADFEWAFVALGDMAFKSLKELKNLTDAAFDALDKK